MKSPLHTTSSFSDRQPSSSFHSMLLLLTSFSSFAPLELPLPAAFFSDPARRLSRLFGGQTMPLESQMSISGAFCIMGRLLMTTRSRMSGLLLGKRWISVSA